VARIAERSGVCRGLGGKLEGRRPLGRKRCKWEGDIKMDVKGMGWRAVDRIERCGVLL